MSFRRRSSLAAAVVAAAALPLVVPGASAAAATATCAGAAHVFEVTWNGDMWLYDHTSPATGASTWANIHQIGAGFTGTVRAGAGGDIYRITGDGVLHLYNYSNGNWANTTGTPIGSGWQAFPPSMITVDSAGRIYAVDHQTGTLYMFHYNKNSGTWDDGTGTPMDLGWNKYQSIAAGGDGVVYAEDKTGTLFRYRYDTASQRWTEYGRQVGTGFDGSIFSPGGDVLYFTPLGATGGQLYWYHYNDDTGTWDSDTGRLVAVGFVGPTPPTLTAGTDACAVPAPAPVPDVTPDPAPADAPIAVAGGDLLYTDQSGHVMLTMPQTGSSLAPTRQVGTIVTTAPVSAAMGNAPFPNLAVLDDTGQVWFTGGAHGLGDFVSLGGRMKAVHVIPTGVVGIDLVGEDGSGALWGRQSFDATLKLLPWRPVGVTVTPGTPNTDMPDLDLVSTAVNQDYGVGNTANGNAQVFLGGPQPPTPWVSTSVPVGNDEVVGVGSEVNNLPTLVGYDATAGQAAVRTVGQQPDTWHPLPPLALADHKPVSSLGQFSSFLAENAIAALGADGFVHVTNDYSGQGATYGPWQQVSIQSAATPPTLDGAFNGPVVLAFRGTDGQFYYFTAPQNTTQAPLSFTGGPLQLMPE